MRKRKAASKSKAEFGCPVKYSPHMNRSLPKQNRNLVAWALSHAKIVLKDSRTKAENFV